MDNETGYSDNGICFEKSITMGVAILGVFGRYL